MVTSSAKCVGEANGERSYIVVDIENGIEIEQMVQLKSDPTFANYSYQMFEFEGTPCSHVLSVLRQEKVYTLPFGFILKRWSRNARVVPMTMRPLSMHKEQVVTHWLEDIVSCHIV